MLQVVASGHCDNGSWSIIHPGCTFLSELHLVSHLGNFATQTVMRHAMPHAQYSTVRVQYYRGKNVNLQVYRRAQSMEVIIDVEQKPRENTIHAAAAQTHHGESIDSHGFDNLNTVTNAICLER